jgi:hypothetical protein
METNNHIRVNVQATTNFSEDEEKELRKSIAKILNKRKKPVAEIVPMDKRVYIMNIHVDSIMTSRNADIHRDKHGALRRHVQRTVTG